VPAQQWAYEAGGREQGGRVSEPRNMSSRGHEDSRRGSEAKADGWQAPDGHKPGGDSGEGTGHPRGLRAGPGCRGGTRERGSTTCLRAPLPEWGTG